MAGTTRGVEWAAGIIEGEGCIEIPADRRSGNARLCVYNTDFEMLDELRRIFGCGKIKDRKQRPGVKAGRVWQVIAKDDVERVLVAVRPYLLPRRASRADEALARIAETRQPGFSANGRGPNNPRRTT